jgi:7-cyano-7-deazaguanine synthase
MYSISGAYSVGGQIDGQFLKEIITRAQERGKDSCGITVIDGNKVNNFKTTKKETVPNFFISKIATAILNNNRAEPTTEYIKNKSVNDVQPFASKSFIIAHNGTIANDKELEHEYNLKRDTKIDSAILPPLFEENCDGTVESIREILIKDVVGSFAMAIYDCITKNMYLASNYKPLYILKRNGVLYFTSLKEYFGDIDPLEKAIFEVPPYTLVELGKKISLYSLYANSAQCNNKALVVCSGGLDSTVVAKKLIDDCFDVTLLHFRYKCRAQEKEEAAIKAIAKRLNCEYMFVDTDLFKTVIGNSRLTETKSDLMLDNAGEKSAELAYEWVPARNLIMLSIATGIAEAKGFSYIALGNNLEESGAYPDNEMIFIEKFKQILPYAVNLQKKVNILQPVGNLMKHEIVALGVECNAPMDLTWSCYNNGTKHCGVCGPCYMRKHAFEMNKINEVIQYEND